MSCIFYCSSTHSLSSLQFANHCSEISLKHCCLSIHMHFSHTSLLFALILMRSIILICYQYTTVLFWFWVLYILLIKVASLSFLGITHLSISQNPDWILPPHETLSFFLSLTHVVLSPSPSLSPCLSSSFDDLSIITPHYLLFCIHVTLDFPIRFKHVKGNFCISVLSATARTVVR